MELKRIFDLVRLGLNSTITVTVTGSLDFLKVFRVREVYISIWSVFMGFRLSYGTL